MITLQNLSNRLRFFLSKWRSDDAELVIFDDLFPHLLSAFRVAEFNEYLNHFKHSIVLSDASTFPSISESRSFEEVRKDYGRIFPYLKQRTMFLSTDLRLSNTKLAYSIFLNNAFRFLPIIKQYDLDFVFTLYPGGGFWLDHPDTDRKLREVCSYPRLRKVIVTQKISLEYLQKKRFLRDDQIEFIYGGVLPQNRLIGAKVKRNRYGYEKKTFDICFVANKYTPLGEDKGYPTFIEVCHQLERKNEFFRFHVVGNFSESDIDVTSIKSKIHFYGRQPTEFFPEFYGKIDAILSPNIHFSIEPGSFDGFPTGCCIEAALCGVPVFATDPLNLNVALKPGEEIEIISTVPELIVDRLLYYQQFPDQLDAFGKSCQKGFSRIFGLATQMEPRIATFTKILNKNNQ